MTVSERQQRVWLVERVALGGFVFLGCLSLAFFSYYQAALEVVAVLEPIYLPLLPRGNFVQMCLFDVQYSCSTNLFGMTWRDGDSWFLYSAALALGFVVYTIKGFRPAPLYNAEWATLSQLRDMWLRVTDNFHAPIRRALLLAVLQQKLIGIKSSKIRPELGHVLICGPTRSGKSLHLMCNLLNWSGSAVVVDIKGELHRLTSGHRAKFSDVVILDPSGIGQRYDPFEDIGDSAEALQTAAEVVLQIDRDSEPVFAQRGANAIIAARRTAHLLRKPTLPYLYDVTRWGLWHFVETLRSVDDEQVSASLVRFVGRDVRTLEEKDISDDRFLNSSWSTITSKLTPLLTEGVVKMTSGFDFCAKQMLETPTTLYLRFNEAELDSNKHILRLTVLALITAILRYADRSHDETTLPILLGLDEAGRVNIPRLDDLVSTVAGRGVSALVYVQDLSQFDATYGAAKAKTIRSNCHTKVFYPPKDLETAKYISDYAGSQSRMTRSVSKEAGPFPTRRYLYSESKRELITPDEVRKLGDEHVIIFAGDKAPIKAKRLVYFKVPWMKGFTDLPATKVNFIAKHKVNQVSLTAPQQAEEDFLTATIKK
jgi:type IV secretion system protein VirD4